MFGLGSLGEAGFSAARLGARRPMVVTDPGIIEAGWCDELLGYLREARLTPVVWSAVTPNPKDHEIHAAYERYVEEGCDVLIAIGGGSCIDAAKGVADPVRQRRAGSWTTAASTWSPSRSRRC